MKARLQITELTHDDIVNIISYLFCESDFEVGYKKSDYNSIPADKRYKPSNGSSICFEDKIADCLLNGKTISITDLQAEEEVYGNLKHHINAEDGSVIYYVTLQDFLNGLSCPDALNDVKAIMDETDDYWNSYNIIQYVIFGELIYG